jgi:hypothetical protein
MAHLQKVSLALDPVVVSDLGYIATRLGVSRSALVNNLLTESIPTMRKFLEQVPLSPTPADAVRFRGESAAIVQERIADLQGIADDLFSKL